MFAAQQVARLPDGRVAFELVRAAILEPAAVKKILEHDGLYDEPTHAKPARDDAAFDFE